MAMSEPMHEGCVLTDGSELFSILKQQELGSHTMTFMFEIPRGDIPDCICDMQAIVVEAAQQIKDPSQEGSLFLNRPLEQTAAMRAICPDANSQYSLEACRLGGQHRGSSPVATTSSLVSTPSCGHMAHIHTP